MPTGAGSRPARRVIRERSGHGAAEGDAGWAVLLGSPRVVGGAGWVHPSWSGEDKCGRLRQTGVVGLWRVADRPSS